LNADIAGTEVEGNFISKDSTYTTRDGETHDIVDAHLNYNELLQEDQDELNLANYKVEGSNDNSNLGYDDVLFADGEDSVDAAILDFVHSEDSNAQTVGVVENAPSADLAMSLHGALALAPNDENIV